MEKEHVTGKVDELKGKAKQGVGNATDDPGYNGDSSRYRGCAYAFSGRKNPDDLLRRALRTISLRG